MLNKRNKIKLLVSDTAPLYPPLWGGPIRIWNLFGNLSDRFEVTYAAPEFKLGAKYSQIKPKSNLKEIRVPITKLYYPFRWLELNVLKEKTVNLFSYLFMALDLNFKRILKDEEADVLISSHPWLFPCFKKRRKDQVLIYDAHNCEYLLMREITRKMWYGLLVSLLVKIIEKSACRKSDVVFVCSEEDAKVFVKLYKISEDKIYFFPNGTNSKSTIPSEEKEKIKKELNLKKTIFFVGTYYHPNIEAARFIIDYLSKELADYDFLIAGWVKWAFKDNHLPENVRLLGRIDDNELSKLMNITDVAINPMSSGSGINIKVLDYLSFGLPVVSTPIGARGIKANDKEHLVISELKDFPGKIKELSADQELCARLRINGRKLAEEKYNWKNIRDDLAEVLKAQVKK